MPVTLVLGGARSGKSAYAQREAEKIANADNALVMIATAEALDAEMEARIAQHQAERGGAWQTVEAPVELAAAIKTLTARDVVIIDCLTLWVSNLLMRERDISADAKVLVETLQNTPAAVWAVSNEVGWGIVPENALARQFRDACGRLHQQLAAVADNVVLIVAGLPLSLK